MDASAGSDRRYGTMKTQHASIEGRQTLDAQTVRETDTQTNYVLNARLQHSLLEMQCTFRATKLCTADGS